MVDTQTTTCLEKWATKVVMVTKKIHSQWDTMSLMEVPLPVQNVLDVDVAHERTPVNVISNGDLDEESIAEPENLLQIVAQEMGATSGSMMPMVSLA